MDPEGGLGDPRFRAESMEAGEGFRGLVDAFKSGVRVGGFVVRGRVKRGRFPEEYNIDAFLERGRCREPLFYVKVFTGRAPYYRPWVEVHTVMSSACGVPFGGPVEDAVLDLLSAHTGPGGRVFVEYEWDPETIMELDSGIPPALSRLGYKLLLRGFTWFKDWYYPEGFMEGGRKIQAEKPVSPERAREHLGEIAAQARALIERPAPGLERVGSRARGLLLLLGFR